MKKIIKGKNSLIFSITLLIFFVLTVLTNKYLLVFDVTSVRISAMMNPILGITFGWPAILGCAVANFISDLVSGWGIVTALMGFPSQILYGFIPCFLWRRYVRCNSHITRLDSPKKVFVLILITLANSVYIGFDVGFIQFAVAGNEFLKTSFFAGFNDFCTCVFFGIPLLSIFDLIYSKYTHKGKRKLSFNEKIILATGAVELIAFAVITVIIYVIKSGDTTVDIWSEIFVISIIAFAVIAAVSFLIMSVFGYLRKKHAGLRIIEKPSGTIFVDEKRRLEFVSFPGQSLEYRVKCDNWGYSLENAKMNIAPTYENAWYTQLSNQKGCPMKCLFCDCPAYGYYGNISLEELKYQIRTIIKNTGTTHTNRFEIDFMRMGEPTLNPEILKFIEFDLRNEINSKIDADVIVPYISTMLPKNKKKTLDWLLEYCRIKNEVYDGNADLQFSVCTSDNDLRSQIYKNTSLSLEEIAEIGNQLPLPKGNKYRLNFPITKDTVLVASDIDALFDKNRFDIKLTPVHETFNAVDNGFNITSEYDSFDIFEPIEKAFIELGWNVLVFLDKKTEDDDELTCGNLLLSNIDAKFSQSLTEKKRVGIVVAIELNAIFKLYENIKELPSPFGFKVYSVEKENYILYIAQSGMGECAASAACQMLISKYNVSKIINFGVVGGLTEDMKQLKVCLVEKVVHYKYDCSEFMPMVCGQVVGYDSIFIKTNENLVKNALTMNDDLTLVTCCSGDKFISTAEEKTYLHNTFGGDICDMESAGIVLTCDANKIPCILFKAVSDGLADGAEGFYKELENASVKCLEIANQILDKIANIE